MRFATAVAAMPAGRRQNEIPVGGNTAAIVDPPEQLVPGHLDHGLDPAVAPNDHVAHIVQRWQCRVSEGNDGRSRLCRDLRVMRVRRHVPGPGRQRLQQRRCDLAVDPQALVFLVRLDRGRGPFAHYAVDRARLVAQVAQGLLRFADVRPRLRPARRFVFGHALGGPALALNQEPVQLGAPAKQQGARQNDRQREPARTASHDTAAEAITRPTAPNCMAFHVFHDAQICLTKGYHRP